MTLILKVFISYPYLTGEPLQPNSTFAALSFMNLLIEPMYFVPIVTSLLVNGLIAVRRLEKFLKAPAAENSDGQWDEELRQLLKVGDVNTILIGFFPIIPIYILFILGGSAANVS